MSITAQSSFSVTHSLAVIYHVCPKCQPGCFPYKPPISYTGPNRALKKSLLQGKICSCPPDCQNKFFLNAIGKMPTIA